MVSGNVSRRKVIERGVLLVPALAMLPSMAKAAAAACADPNESLHVSLHYAEESPDPQKNCSTCGFFSADGEKGCAAARFSTARPTPRGTAIPGPPRANELSMLRRTMDLSRLGLGGH